MWAFVESGLGGLMHAFHIPFTGIFLGGFSVLIISLIAHFEQKPFQQILKATLIVMAVKASVNPMTSPMAYIAVGFQGLCGAAIYSLPFRNLSMALGFAVLAMLESAFQKLLILTVLFGTEWLKALDIYYAGVCKTMGIHSESGFSLSIVLVYLSIYFVWGIFLGIWVYRLPKQVQNRMGWYTDLKSEPMQSIAKKNKSKKRVIALFVLTFLMVVYTFIRPEDSKGGGVLAILSRTFLVVLIWVYIVMPLWRKFILKKLIAGKQEHMPEILLFIPYISSKVKPLHSVLQTQYSGWKKWKEFVLGLIVISLHEDANS